MPSPDRDVLRPRQRQNRPRGDDPVVTDDDRPVVQRRIRVKDRLEHHRIDLDIEPDRIVHQILQPDPPLDHHQRAAFPTRHVDCGIHDFGDDLTPPLALKEAETAELRERPAQLGLEDDDDRRAERPPDAGQQPVQHVEIQLLRQQRQHQQQNRDSGQHRRAARTAQIMRVL